MMSAKPEATCDVCRRPFTRFRTTQSVCSLPCAIRVPKIARKAEILARKVTRAQRDAVKPRGKWMAETQAAFNSYIRHRDAPHGCISCGARTGKMNAGHYLSVGARPELRFTETNCHKQCERCNTYLHGNLIPYRAALTELIGRAGVERLEGPHPPAKHTIQDLRAIRDDYRARLKAMNP